MSAPTTHEIVIPAEVLDFVRRHGVEADLHQLCATAQACFPEMLMLNVELQEDPDTPGRTWIKLRVTLPRDYPWQQLYERETPFHEESVRLGRARSPLSSLVFDFVLGMTFATE